MLYAIQRGDGSDQLKHPTHRVPARCSTVQEDNDEILKENETEMHEAGDGNSIREMPSDGMGDGSLPLPKKSRERKGPVIGLTGD